VAEEIDEKDCREHHKRQYREDMIIKVVVEIFRAEDADE